MAGRQRRPAGRVGERSSEFGERIAEGRIAEGESVCDTRYYRLMPPTRFGLFPLSLPALPQTDEGCA